MLNRVFPWTFFLLIPVGLVINQYTYYPHTFDKNLLFRFLVPLLFCGACFYTPTFKKLLEQKKVFLSFSVFILIAYIASFFGMNFSQSFWSTAERAQGLLNLTLMFFLFAMFYLFFQKRHWKIWFLAHTFIALGISLYELPHALQNYTENLHFTFFLGNRSYFAAYLLSAMCGLWILIKNETFPPRSVLFLKGILVWFAIVLVFTGSKGAILAAIVGLIIEKILTPRQLSSTKNKLMWIIPFMIWNIAATIILVSSKYHYYQYVDSALRNPRFFIWKVPFQSFKEYPLLGVGYEQFLYAFDHFYPAWFPKGEDWIDHAHNLFLEILTTTGVVGLACFIVFLYQLVKGFKKKEAYAYGIFAALVAGQFFHKDATENQVMFYSLMSFLLQNQNEQEDPRFDFKGGFVGILLFIPVSFFSYKYLYQEHQTNRNLLAHFYELDTAPQRNASEIKSILMGPSVYSQDWKILYAEFLLNIRKEIKDYPDLKSMFLNSLRPFLSEKSHTSKMNTLMAEAFYHNGYLQEGLDQINKAIQHAPKRAKNYLYRAAIYRLLGKSDEAFQDCLMAYGLDIGYRKAKFMLAAMADERGDTKLAIGLLGENYKQELLNFGHQESGL